MSWKFVFDTNKKFAAGTHIDDIITFVTKTDYKFFNWNGEVYFLEDYKAYYTGLTTDDLF